MAEMSRLVKLRDKLQTGEDIKDTLDDLNTILESASSNTEVLQIVSIVNPQLLFSYLANNEQVGLQAWNKICSILSKMLHAFPLSGIANMSQEIELGLQHSYEGVRILCVKLLWNKVSEPLHAMLLRPTLLHLVTQLLGDQSLECAQSALKILEYLLTKPDTSSAIVSSELKDGLLLDLNGLVAKGDVVRFRVYELVARLAKTGGNSSTFELLESAGFVSDLIGQLESPDVLIKLNCLELLQTMAETTRGLEIVNSSDVLRKLHLLLSSVGSDPLNSVLIPGAIKFFGSYCQMKDITPVDICTSYPLFLSTVCDAIHQPEEDTVWGVAMDTLALFGSTMRGRKALNGCGIDIDGVFTKLGQFVSHPKSELKIRALKCLSAIFSCDEVGVASETSLSYRWYKLAGAGLVATVMTLMKQPFPEIHLVGLRFLLSICCWEWGQVEMKNTPGFVELLLDRKTETEREGRELKYNIIKSIAESIYAEEIFGSPILLSFRRYVLEGTFYVKADSAAVAFEEM